MAHVTTVAIVTRGRWWVEIVLRSDVGGAGLAGGHGGGHRCNRENLKPPVIVIITRDTAGHCTAVNDLDK